MSAKLLHSYLFYSVVINKPKVHPECSLHCEYSTCVSDEMHHAVLTLLGNSELVVMAHKLIVLPVVVVPVLGPTHTVSDGKLQHRTWLQEGRHGQVKAEGVKVEMAAAALREPGGARHPGGLGLRVALPLCEGIADGHLLVKVQVQHLGDADDAQFETQHPLKAHLLPVEATEELRPVPRLLGENRFQVGQGDLQMRAVGHLGAHQQLKGDVLGYEGVLTGVEELDVFQVKP